MCDFYFFLGFLLTEGLFLSLLQVLGIFIAVWTIWTIKVEKFFLTLSLSKNHRFVPKGIHKIIRYPLFPSILLISSSLVFSCFTLLRLGVFLLLMLSSISHLIYKNSIFSRNYNDYSLYKQKTYRAIPFLT